MRIVYVCSLHVYKLMDLLQTNTPIGELCHVEAELTYTSKNSMEISIEVFAENLQSGEKRMTNTARFWFVPVLDYTKGSKLGRLTVAQNAVPQVRNADGEKRYLEQKKLRTKKIEDMPSADTLKVSEMMLPSDCYANHSKC